MSARTSYRRTARQHAAKVEAAVITTQRGSLAGAQTVRVDDRAVRFDQSDANGRYATFVLPYTVRAAR